MKFAYSRYQERQTWRMLGLVAAIAVLCAAFDLLTDGIFFTPRNLSNLAVQTSVTALLAVGMTWLMVARQIDLSGGALVALLGVVAARCQAISGWPFGATLAAVLGLGLLAGLVQGLLVTRLGIPAFIATLAAFSYLRGAAYIASDGTTITGLGEQFSAIANTNVPRAISVGIFLAVGVASAWRQLRQATRHDGAYRLIDVITAAVAVSGALLGAWAFGTYRGIPAPVAAIFALIVASTFVTNQTAFGRHVFAIGASPEAARRAGIDVNRLVLILFVLSSLLASFGALIESSRLDAGSPDTAGFIALDAISAAVIGGTSLFGGRGTVAGSALGALLISTIANGLGMMGSNTYWQLVATGLLLLAALLVERAFSRGEPA
jgi:D-xylose transport system permease protein